MSDYKINKNRPLFGIVPRIVFNRRFSYIPLGIRLKFGLLGKSFQQENDQLRQILAHVADHATKELGCEVIFFAADTNLNASDDGFTRDIVNRMRFGAEAKIISGDYLIEEVLAMFREMDLVLSMRLHGLIFASSQYVPVIAISSSGKIERYMETIGHGEYCIARKGLNEKELKYLVKTALSRRHLITQTLKARMSFLEGLASRNYELFLELKKGVKQEGTNLHTGQ